MPAKSEILVGKIVAAHGLRGLVCVQTYTERPEDFKDLAIMNPKLSFVRADGANAAICAVDGVGDRTAAESLRGTELFVERDSLPAPADGEYYQADLIGMKVFIKGNAAGVVAAVHNFGAGDILELESGEMLSFLGASVDMEQNKINLP
jgi:16S rRNA processing protein RimM